MTDPALVNFVTNEDIQIVLSRIPDEHKTRLRDVFMRPGSFGVRWLGQVRRRGRRDITLHSVLPPRVSLSRFVMKGSSPAEFGAPQRGQWPPWAVRRFLLYEVLLHELGHLQLVRPEGRGWDRKFASETLANEFAIEWRNRLYAQPFEHVDPVHNAPTDDELSLLPVWQAQSKSRRAFLVHLVVGAPHGSMPDVSSLGPLERREARFLRRLLCHESDVTLPVSGEHRG